MACAQVGGLPSPNSLRGLEELELLHLRGGSAHAALPLAMLTVGAPQALAAALCSGLCCRK